MIISDDDIEKYWKLNQEKKIFKFFNTKHSKDIEWTIALFSIDKDGFLTFIRSGYYH